MSHKIHINKLIEPFIDEINPCLAWRFARDFIFKICKDNAEEMRKREKTFTSGVESSMNVIMDVMNEVPISSQAMFFFTLFDLQNIRAIYGTWLVIMEKTEVVHIDEKISKEIENALLERTFTVNESPLCPSSYKIIVLSAIVYTQFRFVHTSSPKRYVSYDAAFEDLKDTLTISQLNGDEGAIVELSDAEVLDGIF